MNTIDTMIVDRFIRQAQVLMPYMPGFGGEEQRQEILDQMLFKYREYAKRENEAGREPLAFHLWEVSPAARNAILRAVLGQDKVLDRCVERTLPDLGSLRPEMRDLFYNQVIFKHLEAVKAESEPLSLNQWLMGMAPAVRRAHFIKILAQVALRPDSSPSQAREALREPLSAWMAAEVVNLQVSAQDGELRIENGGSGEADLDLTADLQVGLMADDLHLLLQRSVPLPFDIQGSTGEVEPINWSAFGEITRVGPLEGDWTTISFAIREVPSRMAAIS